MEARYVKFVVQEFVRTIHMRADVIVRSCSGGCGVGETPTTGG